MRRQRKRNTEFTTNQRTRALAVHDANSLRDAANNVLPNKSTAQYQQQRFQQQHKQQRRQRSGHQHPQLRARRSGWRRQWRLRVVGGSHPPLDTHQSIAAIPDGPHSHRPSAGRASSDEFARMLIGVITALVACLSYGVSSVLQAYAARRSATAAQARGRREQRTATGAPTLASTVAAALTVWFIIGTALDVIGFAGGGVSARLIPLFLSQTIVSANLIVTAVLGTVVLGIRLHRRDWIAIATVILALMALGAAAGHEGGGSADPALHRGIFLASVLVLGLGQLVVRRLGSGGAVAAGLIAGLLFGALAIAVRIVDGIDPVQWSVLVADPAAWTIAIAGAGGFYLHTVALQLGSVNGATAALVVGETVLPGIVGVLLLGDTSRPGLGVLAALGFLLSIGGAVAVAIFGAAGAADHSGTR